MENTFQQFLKNNEKIIGAAASFLGVVMFASLIEVFISNIKGESHIFIQPIATAVNGLIWSLYAYGRRDMFLLVPNILALVLGIATGIAAFV